MEIEHGMIQVVIDSHGLVTERDKGDDQIANANRQKHEERKFMMMIEVDVLGESRDWTCLMVYREQGHCNWN